MDDKIASEIHYIAAGVKKDCLTLIEKFTENKTYDFNIFLNIWKEMKFPFIFGLRDTFAELIEFTEEVFLIVKNIWLQFEDLYSSVCAFYILTGVYRKQPTRNMVKIRLTFTDLEKIFLFLKKCQDTGIPNILQMYDELDKDGAFMFVVFERQYGFERNLRKYFHNPPDLRPQNEENENAEQRKAVPNYVDYGQMDLFGMQFKEYNEIKKQLAKPLMKYPYLEWINKLKEGFDFISSNNSLTQAKPKKSSSTNKIGLVRKNIKEKAFKNKISSKTKSARLSRKKNVNLNNSIENKTVQEPIPSNLPKEINNREPEEGDLNILEDKNEDFNNREPEEGDLIIVEENEEPIPSNLPREINNREPEEGDLIIVEENEEKINNHEPEEGDLIIVEENYEPMLSNLPKEINNLDPMKEELIIMEEKEDLNINLGLKTEQLKSKTDINEEIEDVIKILQEDRNILNLDNSFMDLDLGAIQEDIGAYSDLDKIDISSDKGNNSDIQPLVNGYSLLNPIDKKEDILTNEINTSQQISMNNIYENSTETNTWENNPEQIIITNRQDLNNENITKLEPNKIVNKRKYNKSLKSNKKIKIDVNVNSSSVESNINKVFDNNNLLTQEYLQPNNSKDEKLNEKAKKKSNDQHSSQKTEINIKDKTNKMRGNRKKLNKNNCKSNLTNLCEEIEVPKDSTNMEDQKQENTKIKKKTTKRAKNCSISSKNQIKNKFIEMLVNDKKNELKFDDKNEIKSNLKDNSKLVDFEKNKNLKTDDLMDKMENSQPILRSKNVSKGKQKTKIMDSQLSCELIKKKSEKIKENKNKKKQPKGEKIEKVEIFQQIDKVVVNKKQTKTKKSTKDIQQKKDTDLNESIPKATLLKKKDNKNQKKGNQDKTLKSNKIESSKEMKTIDVKHVDDDHEEKLKKINDKAKNKKTLVKKPKVVNPTKRNLRSQNKNK